MRTTDYFPPEDSIPVRVWRAIRRFFQTKPACPCSYSKLPGRKINGHEGWCRMREEE
jgi:hypothetical protein